MSSVCKREACSKTELDMLSLKNSEQKLLRRSKYEFHVGEGGKYTCIMYLCVYVKERERETKWQTVLLRVTES